MPIACAMSIFSESLNPGFFSSTILRARAGFFQYLPQRHVLARARLHQLPVFAENVAERNVAEIGFVSFPASDLKYLFKVQSLWRADHVPNRVAPQFVHSIIN